MKNPLIPFILKVVANFFPTFYIGAVYALHHMHGALLTVQHYTQRPEQGNLVKINNEK